MRVRSKISGTDEKPRISVFRSNKHIYAQVIDDVNMKTLVQSSDKEVKKSVKSKKNKSEIAREVGKILGKKLKKVKIDKVVFDRSGYKYHGRVKELAEGVRKVGINF